MKYLFIITIILVTGAACSHAAVTESVEAVVNDEIITSSEIDAMLAPFNKRYEKRYTGTELREKIRAARSELIERCIDEKLILREAEKQEIRKLMGDDFMREVEKGVAEIKREFPSDALFIRALEANGMSLDQFRERQEERTLIRLMLIKEVSRKCEVSPREVQEYYREHRDEFMEKEKAHVSQIWIKAKGGENRDAAGLANSILEKLGEGTAFETLAKKYSDGPYAACGGDWGFIPRGHWNRVLEDAVFALDERRYSNVIETPLGYHIVLLHAKKPPERKPLKKVYPEIESALFRQKAAKKREEWITKLRENAYIRR